MAVISLLHLLVVNAEIALLIPDKTDAKATSVFDVATHCSCNNNPTLGLDLRRLHYAPSFFNKLGVLFKLGGATFPDPNV